MTARATARASARLAAEGVHLRHPGADRDSVRDLHLRVEPGEIVCLVGPNGSGKSTTLAGLGRDLRPREGTVRLDGEDVWRLPRRRFARAVARLPQEPRSPEGLTVEALVTGGRNPHLPLLGAPRAADRRAVAQALREMDLADLRHRTVETLSGGERRRAWIAMVLAQEADALLLDEPTAGLDLRHQWEVLDLLVRINRERKATLVVVLHDLEQAARIAHRLAVFHRGRLYRAAPPGEVLEKEMLRDVFRVEADVRREVGALRLRVERPADPIRSL